MSGRGARSCFAETTTAGGIVLPDSAADKPSRGKVISIGDGRLQLSADVFNVFNRENLSGFANSATQSNQIQVFGQPFTQRNAGAPRQFQFGLRYIF